MSHIEPLDTLCGYDKLRTVSNPFARVRVNEQGRLVLPAALRCLVGIVPGETVAVSVVGDHLEIVSDAALLARMWAATEGVARDGSVTDELIAERRAEAAREALDTT